MLPIKTVVLYKHGVGFFERLGPVEGDTEIELNFKGSEMNDVLKSLTMLDMGDGSVSSVSYDSTETLAKQLEDVGIHLSEQDTLTSLLTQLHGAGVQIEVAGQTLTGKLIGLERRRQIVDGTVVETHTISLYVGGAVLTHDLADVRSISLQDETLRARLEHLLDALIASKTKDNKRLTIFAKGTGARDVSVSYLVETPVWKTSYRVLIGEGEQQHIQGWAMVDNTQSDDWTDVDLTLVAGLPISFVHDLYSPRHKRRPVVEVDEEQAYAPPVLEYGTRGASEDALADGAAMSVAAGSAPPAPAARPAPQSAARKRKMAAPGRSSVEVQTRTAEVGDLFHYEIVTPVTVRSNQSALVPILEDTVKGRRVAIYNEEVRAKNPMSALEFENTTDLTLEGGPVTVIERESYSGEAMLDTVKPGQTRLLPYAVELSCVVDSKAKVESGDVTSVIVQNGAFVIRRTEIARRTYAFDNQSDRTLSLYVDHPRRSGFTLPESLRPEETTERFHRFQIDVAPNTVGELEIEEHGYRFERSQVIEGNSSRLGAWLTSRGVSDDTRATLAPALAVSAELGALEVALAQVQSQMDELFTDQQRLRQNLESLGSSEAERQLRDRYVRELTNSEDRLATLRASKAEAQSAHGAKRAQLAAELEALAQ